MYEVNRSTLRDYAQTIKGLTNEELHKEIWMLEEHIKYLTHEQCDSSQFKRFLSVAKEEKEMRMVSQGYQ
jgi:hypothetical protein